MSIAVLQNSVGIGGRSKVVAEVIKSLGTNGNQICLFTLSSDKDVSTFINTYQLSGYELRVRNYPGMKSIVPGTLYQQPALNIRVRRQLSSFYLVFNSNNCLRFLPSGPAYLHYVHLPTPSIPMTNQRYTQSLTLQIYALPMNILQGLSTGVSSTGITITNSKYTADIYKEIYNQSPNGVLYPPAIESVKLSTFDGQGIVSLGAFHPNKRQLFQIKVAENLPNVEFTIIGNKISNRYYQRCIDYINGNSINNVKLCPDTPPEQVKRLLKENGIFLHSMKNEPFGISTVEAINHGCVPVVHNSGGQQEIVTDPRLRYKTLDECVKTVQGVKSGQINVDADTFAEHIRAFELVQFRKELQTYLKKEYD